MFHECLLNGPEFFTVHQTFYRRNLFTYRLYSKGHASVTGLSIDQNGAGPAFTPLTANLRSGQPEFFTEDKEERPSWFNQQTVTATVDQ
jgi:hypothetical protein